MKNTIEVDKDRYEALETLFEVLRYQSEVYGPDEQITLRSVWQTIFELSKNTSMLGPEKDLIKQYEHLAETEYLFRCALAEIANMGGEAGIRARKALDKWNEDR